jgi:concanavalin A-like lectin/glucanase superfamily protein
MHGHPSDWVPRLALGAAMVAGVLMAAAPAAATMTQVGLWHMDEGPGAKQMLDSSGFNNHGKIGAVNTGLTGPDAFLGAAYRFTGKKGSMVEVPSSSSLIAGSAAFVAQLHAKFTNPNPPTETFDLIRKGLSSTSGGDFKMEVLPGGKIGCHFKTSSKTTDVKSKSNLADGRWHTIACVRTASEVQVVVDGTTYRKSVKLGSITNAAKVTIGAKTANQDVFDGFLDEVSLSIDR